MTLFTSRDTHYRTGEQRIPERLLAPGDYRAPEKDLAAEVAHGSGITLRASGLGPFPGRNMVDALYRIRGELGSPNLPFLPELPERGWQGTTLARTIATLTGLEFEGASYGWRLVHARPGTTRESTLARALYESDINALADVVGSESRRAPDKNTSHEPVLKVQLCGLYTFATKVFLPHGERAISDSGAVRDLRDAFLEGLEQTLKLLRQALDASEACLEVQLNEPELASVVRGSIPTVSGLRTLKAVPRAEVYETYRMYAEYFASLHVVPSLNLEGVPLESAVVNPRTSKNQTGINVVELARVLSTAHQRPALSFDPEQVSGLVNVPPMSDPRRWETVAAVLEADAYFWLPLSVSPTVAAHARKMWRIWRELGLGPSELHSLGVIDRASETQISPQEATVQMARTAEYAQIVAEIAAEGLG